jgi:hypothetical protein
MPGIRAVKEGVRAGAGSGFVTGKNMRYETADADVVITTTPSIRAIAHAVID